jgi:predicted component of type VI protein secretion system
VRAPRDDGAYALRDAGSTNGTTLNDDLRPLARDVTMPLSDGDRIRVGAWTTITVRTRQS